MIRALPYMKCSVCLILLSFVDFPHFMVWSDVKIAKLKKIKVEISVCTVPTY